MEINTDQQDKHLRELLSQVRDVLETGQAIRPGSVLHRAVREATKSEPRPEVMA